jgi:hypothetical protein
MEALAQVRKFFAGARKSLRQGELSREDLKLLRLEWKPDLVECDWLMRAPDQWDSALPISVSRENQTVQAFKDALTLRDLIFRWFPNVNHARLRMLGPDEDGALEVVMIGNVTRENEIYRRIPSLVMRAKLCGFDFSLTHGVLEKRALTQ